MSTTSQLTDFSDLYVDLQNRTRHQTGVTATENQAKRYTNIALHDMHLGLWEKMPWAERHTTLRTQPEYSTGTVAITKGATALVGTGTAWATNNDFGVNNVRTSGKLVINGSEEVYTISAVTDDTNIVLNERFIDDTVTAATYSYFEDEYDLASDFLRPVDIQTFSQDLKIPIVPRERFREQYPRNKVVGRPEVATMVHRGFSGSTTEIRRVRFHKPPDRVYLIPYSYITGNLAVASDGTGATNLSADTDEPIVPLGYRHAIVFHALYHWYRDRKNDARATAAKDEYTDIMLRIIGSNEVGENRPRIQPRLAAYKRAAKRPYSRRTRRFTTGTTFDELRE